MEDEKQEGERKGRALHAQMGFHAITGGEATLSVWGQIPEGHEVYAMVGRIAVAWSYVDHTLNNIIWDLALHDTPRQSRPTIAAITSNLSNMSARCDVIRALAEARGLGAKTVDQVKKFPGVHGTAQRMRNRAVHDAWYAETGSGEVAVYHAMARPAHESDARQFGISPFKKEDFHRIMGKIDKARRESEDLRKTIQSELETLLGTSR